MAIAKPIRITKKTTDGGEFKYDEHGNYGIARWSSWLAAGSGVSGQNACAGELRNLLIMKFGLRDVPNTWDKLMEFLEELIVQVQRDIARSRGHAGQLTTAIMNHEKALREEVTNATDVMAALKLWVQGNEELWNNVRTLPMWAEPKGDGT